MQIVEVRSKSSQSLNLLLRENINTANNVLTNALPRLADELVTMAMEKSVKPYSRIAAISEAFKIVNTNVLEAEQRRQLMAIRQLLDNLEDGGSQVIDV